MEILILILINYLYISTFFYLAWVYTNKNWIDSYKNLYKVGEYL